MDIIKRIKTFLGMYHEYKNWYTALLELYGLLGNGYVLYFLRNNLKIKARKKSGDTIVLNEILVKKEYEIEGLDIKPGFNVIDIGAHIGVFTLYASSKGAIVYSYEPVKENFILLKENILLNRFRNVKPFMSAVAGKRERRNIFLSIGNSGGSTLIQGWVENRKRFNINPVKVKTITLMDIFKLNKIETCDILKMDCEGSEYEILLNTPVKILKRIKAISMECHEFDKYNSQVLVKYLEKNGFTIKNRNRLDKDIVIVHAVNNNCDLLCGLKHHSFH